MQEAITSSHPALHDEVNVVDIRTIREKIRIVVDNKIIDSRTHPEEYRLALIKLTERLAEEAKSGELLGLGGFAEYKDGYRFGLEGSYWENPETAVLPLMRLHRRIMQQIESEEEAEE